MNAIRVAFAATYTQAVPNARRAQYYNAKISAVNQWVARRCELENVTNTTEVEDGNVPGQVTIQGRIMQDVTPDSVAHNKRRIRDKGRFVKRKNIGIAAPKKRRSQLELLRMGGHATEMGNLGVPMADVQGGDAEINSSDVVEDGSLGFTVATATSTESSFAELLPSITIAQAAKGNRTKLQLPQPANKKTRFSSRTSISLPSSSTNSSTRSLKLPKPSNATVKPSKKTDAGEKEKIEWQKASYDILSHWPGITEVIFDRYPALHKLANAKRGKKRVSSANRNVRKMPDMKRLSLLCKKASDTAVTVKAGAENSAIDGSGQLIFLRRNLPKMETQAGGGIGG